LTSQLNVKPGEMDRMGYVSKEATLHGRPVRYIRIFDPSIIPGGARVIGDYDFLGSQYWHSVLFEGHVERSSSIYLVDRRPPSRLSIPSKVQYDV